MREILVRNATKEFGFAPHDVHNGVFALHDTMEKHNAAVHKLDYPRLNPSSKCSLTISNSTVSRILWWQCTPSQVLEVWIIGKWVSNPLGCEEGGWIDVVGRGPLPLGDVP